ncbi:CEL-like protein [Mya arenaria]|uniref:Carboxylic ester hydrolase n=1 Tax=Mya arenaria TaxID=6604 RepID=A0ABY7EI38_MYAAR|nr:bile salt-activated lipase-like [Mya arenaria]WAR08318.1 CEL-like protein [Mya arenaria]
MDIFNCYVALLFVCYAIRRCDSAGFSSQKVLCATPIGKFIGVSHLASFNNKTKIAMRFLQIPYAKPPIGDLRLRRPVPFEFKADQTYDATEYGPHCIQSIFGDDFYTNERKQSEDCLHLNLYVPGNKVDSRNRFAVMLYIHGGSFAVGGGEIYAGDTLSAFNDVIVVTINYRLDVFGFLSSGAKNDGNYGLWDMHMSIQWVHDNIGFFGGDNLRVTLFGNSAGGAAVLFQALYPPNRGLIQRVIAQSGSCFSGWAVQRHPRNLFERLLEQMPCSSQNGLECLRTLDAVTLQRINIHRWFVPSVDNDFVPINPAYLPLRTTERSIEALDFFSEIDFMTGIMSKDGSLSLIHRTNDISERVTMHEFEKYINGVVSWEYSKTLSKDRLSEIVSHYARTGVLTRDTEVDFRTDLTFLLGAKFALETHSSRKLPSSQGHTFFYVFNQTPSFAPKLHFLNGVSHVFELPYVFGFPKEMEHKFIRDYKSTSFSNVSGKDIELSEQIMNIWSNFAKFGNPNIRDGNTGVDVPFWPPFTTLDGYYLELKAGMTNASAGQHYEKERTKVLEDMYYDLQISGSGILASATSINTHSAIVLLYIFWLFTQIII